MPTEKELKKKTVKTMKGRKPFKDEIEKRLSGTDSERIWKNAHKRLYKMYSEHTDIPKGCEYTYRFFHISSGSHIPCYKGNGF